MEVGRYAQHLAPRPGSRPAFILGPIGDKHGRKAALVWSVLLMGGATTVMGLLPTYAVAGILGPILLVLLRVKSRLRL